MCGSAGYRIFFTVIGLIVFLASLFIAFVGNAPTSISNSGNSTTSLIDGLFIQTVESLDAKYPNDISPADWVFVILWPLVYLWNLIGIIYLIASLFLSNNANPILGEPVMIPVPSLICWSLLWGLSFSWLFVYDREYILPALFCIIGAAWSGYGFLGFSYRCYARDVFYLEKHSLKMLWIVRILVHNGIAIVTTWLTCAWKINLATVIAYTNDRSSDKVPAELRGTLSPEDAGTVALSILLLEFVVWFILENFVFEPYCRYTVSIYPTLIFVFCGLLVGNQQDGLDTIFFNQNRIIALAGLILAVVACMARIAFVVLKHRKRLTLS